MPMKRNADKSCITVDEVALLLADHEHAGQHSAAEGYMSAEDFVNTLFTDENECETQVQEEECEREPERERERKCSEK